MTNVTKQNITGNSNCTHIAIYNCIKGVSSL